MSDYYDQITRQFVEWTALGQGGLPAMDDVIDLEPPFRPFLGYKVQRKRVVDDGQRPSFFGRLLGAQVGAPKPDLEEPESEELDFRFIEDRQRTIELKVLLPDGYSADQRTFSQFLKHLDDSVESITVEFVAIDGNVSYQLAVGERDVDVIEGLLGAYFPEIVVIRSRDSFETA